MYEECKLSLRVLRARTMSQLAWRDVAPEMLVRVWSTFETVFATDIKEDTSHILEKLQSVGCELDEETGFITWQKIDNQLVSNLEQRVDSWLHQTAAGTLDCLQHGKASSFGIKQMTLCISKRHSHVEPRQLFSPSQLQSSETVCILPRTYLVTDGSGDFHLLHSSGDSKHPSVEEVAKCWHLRRMLMVMEIETTTEREEAMPVEIPKVAKTQRETPAKPASTQVRADKFINSTELLPMLQLAYVNMHKPLTRYSALGVHEKECCLGVELQNQLGNASDGPSAVSKDIDLLIEWEKLASKQLLTVSLTNLRYCESDILQKYDICAQPGDAKSINPEATKQVEYNVKNLESCFRWFRGNGSQPKWRVEFYNHEKKRTVSGKAAPPWDVIAKAYMNNFNHSTQEPVNTPISRG